MKSLGIITARGASKRLPRKNIRPLLGIPLLAYMCRAALASRLDRIVVTTEDDEIARIAEEYGVPAPFRRPAELADDWARSEDIAIHALEWCEANDDMTYDVIVLLQPTTPFVQPRHIDACLNGLADNRVACCFAARETSEPPQWMYRTMANGDASLLLGGVISGDSEHTQKLEKTYFPSGAAYAVRSSAMRDQQRILCEPARLAVMEPEYAIDIDDALDWMYAETVARHYNLTILPPMEQTR